MDLCGPMRIMSRGGKKYVMVLVDDYSRFTWTLFLASKEEAFNAFSISAKKIQRTLDTHIISIKPDHGTEFENRLFYNFCSENGISHNFSSPRTAQQNGVVEKKNKTLEEMARAMLLSGNLPQSFWDEAINTAYYTINRCMARPLIEKIPYELLKGRKPNISHPMAFGC